jgi:hypothetical protein
MAKARRPRARRPSRPEQVEYRFKIERFTPETISMARLAEYMADLARIMGETEHVHFRRLERSSAVIVPVVSWQAVPKVRARVHSVKRRQAAIDVLRVADALNEKLAADNTSATLLDGRGAKVIAFPGRGAESAPEFAVTEPGELYGNVIVIGGKNDPVPVHLEDGETVHLCEASRSVARQLATHLFGATLAIDGTGRWVRKPDGTWEMRTFRISSFRVLDDRPLTEVVRELKTLPGDWRTHGNPLAELRDIRKAR